MDFEYSKTSRGLATGALVLAILAVPFFFLFYVSIPLGATAIILALLSRGRGKLRGRAKTATLIGTAAIAFSASFTVYLFVSVYQSPDLQRQIEQIVEYYFDYYGLNEEDSLLPDEEKSYQILGLEEESEYTSPTPGQNVAGGMQI